MEYQARWNFAAPDWAKSPIWPAGFAFDGESLFVVEIALHFMHSN
jgi:hypothetical protein